MIYHIKKRRSQLTMLFLFWVIHFPPTKYKKAILYSDHTDNKMISKTEQYVAEMQPKQTMQHRSAHLIDMSWLM